MAANEPAAITVKLSLHLLLQAHVPQIAGEQPVTLSLPAGATVKSMLYDTCGLPGDIQVFSTINGCPASVASVLRNGDEIYVFMAVGGG